MAKTNSQDLNTIREQLNLLHKENHELRLKIAHDKERKLIKKKEYEDKIEKFQILANDASIRLTEGSELIRKLQQHLKICQEKLSDQKQALCEKDELIHHYQTCINHLNDKIKQLTDDEPLKRLQFSLNFNDNEKVDVAVQTSPTQRRSVRFNLDKENRPIDSKYFQPRVNNLSK